MNISEKNDRSDKNNKNIKYISYLVFPDGKRLEMVYDSKNKVTQLVYLDSNQTPVYIDSYDWEGSVYLPYPPDNGLVANGFILFPSKVSEYGTEEELIECIRLHIHRYLDVPSFIEKILTHYVLLSWVFENFNELPYSRAIAEFGSGKTRMLQTVGGLCYKPMFASGSTSTAAIFRICDEFRGTLVLDEADFNQSDEAAEIIKILNNGFAKGMPVLRCETKKDGNFKTIAFDVFGPKIIATRSYFKDRALESRCISFELNSGNLRQDIPINLTDVFWEEACEIRSKLLLYRFRHSGKKVDLKRFVSAQIEPRINQIIAPLASIIVDPNLILTLQAYMKDQFRSLVVERSFGIDGQLLETIDYCYQNSQAEPTMKQLAEAYLELFPEEKERFEMSPRKIGAQLRRSFHVHTEKRNRGYVLSYSQRPQVERAMLRYGIHQKENKIVESSGQEPSLTDEVKEVFGVEYPAQHALPSSLS